MPARVLPGISALSARLVNNQIRAEIVTPPRASEEASYAPLS